MLQTMQIGVAIGAGFAARGEPPVTVATRTGDTGTAPFAILQWRNRAIGAAMGTVLGWGAAQAEVKDPLPDSLSLGGVTLYATLDIGYAYQSHGVPLSSEVPGGLEYQAFTTTRNFAGSQSTFAESGLEQSKIGIRVTEPIVNDFTLIAKADTGFNPLSGQLVS